MTSGFNLDSTSGGATGRDDLALMQAIARQEPDALRELYQRHSGLILALCYRITQNRGDAEDVLLDVFWEIWNRADRYDTARASPLTYLTLIARSRALDHRRANPPTKSSSSHHESESPTPTAPSAAGDEPRPGPLGELLADEKRASVRAALGGLSSEERELIEFCYFDGLTHSEIAQRTHQPLGTIKTRIRRGLARLRGRLRCVWDERPDAPPGVAINEPASPAEYPPATAMAGTTAQAEPPSALPASSPTSRNQITESASGPEVV